MSEVQQNKIFSSFHRLKGTKEVHSKLPVHICIILANIYKIIRDLRVYDIRSAKSFGVPGICFIIIYQTKHAHALCTRFGSIFYQSVFRFAMYVYSKLIFK